MKNTPPLMIFAEYIDRCSIDDLIRLFAEDQRLSYSDMHYDSAQIIFEGISYELSLTKRAAFPTKLEKNKQIFSSESIEFQSSLSLALGSNVEGGQMVPPIMASLFRLAVLISEKVGARIICWNPARQIVGIDHFRDAVSTYSEGGPFPVLALISIDSNSPQSFTTNGLAYFSGQELRVTGPTTMSQSDVVKRMVRMIHDVAVHGAFEEDQTVAGLKHGEEISVHVDDRGKSNSYADIRITSNMDQI